MEPTLSVPLALTSSDGISVTVVPAAPATLIFGSPESCLPKSST